MRLLLAFLAAGSLMSSAGCGGESTEGEVVVLAAASLTDAFTALAGEFELAHPDTAVVVSFAASSELATQIIEGAPVDVFASADLANMERLTDVGVVDGEVRIFATNRSEIMVAAGNPLGVTGVADLADPDIVVVTCAPEVPCGTYAAQIFDKAGVAITADSYETNVRAVVTKVTLGEADAGIVYSTDVVAAADGADGVPIPDEWNVVAEYPIASLSDATNPESASAFIDFVLGDEGRAILADFGFAGP